MRAQLNFVTPGAYSTQVSAPARAVHSDLHGQFGFEQLRVQPLAEAAWREIDERLEGREPPRWRAFNLWQMISEPPQDVAPALCALDSVAADGVVEAQRWHCFPSMQPGETLIFSAFDPQADSRKARVPRGAVDLPPAADRTIPRNSIEIRAMVIY